MSPITSTLLFSLITPFVTVLGAPAVDANSLRQNGLSAQQLNAQFASLKTTDSCQGSDMACVEGSFAQCVGGKWQTTQCAGGTQCFALPLLNKVGTSITCDTQADAVTRINQTGASGGLTGSGSQAQSLTSANSASGDNCTDPGSNSTSPSGISGSANSAVNTTNTDTGLGSSSVASGADASGTSAPAGCGSAGTVTVTVAASSVSSAFSTTPFSAAPTRSPTLASGFTLPPTSTSNLSGATPTPNSFSSVSGSTALASNGTDVASPAPTDITNATFTLSPSSASAFLSSLSAANPGVTVSTVAQSAATDSAPSSIPGANATAAASSSSSNISLSFFSTSLPSAAASASPVSSLVASASSAAAGGYGGSGYRVRRLVPLP